MSLPHVPSSLTCLGLLGHDGHTQDRKRSYKAVQSCDEGVITAEALVALAQNATYMHNVLGPACIFLRKGFAENRTAVRKSGHAHLYTHANSKTSSGLSCEWKFQSSGQQTIWIEYYIMQGIKFSHLHWLKSCIIPKEFILQYWLADFTFSTRHLIIDFNLYEILYQVSTYSLYKNITVFDIAFLVVWHSIISILNSIFIYFLQFLDNSLGKQLLWTERYMYFKL